MVSGASVRFRHNQSQAGTIRSAARLGKTRGHRICNRRQASNTKPSQGALVVTSKPRSHRSLPLLAGALIPVRPEGIAPRANRLTHLGAHKPIYLRMVSRSRSRRALWLPIQLYAAPHKLRNATIHVGDDYEISSLRHLGRIPSPECRGVRQTGAALGSGDGQHRRGPCRGASVDTDLPHRGASVSTEFPHRGAPVDTRLPHRGAPIDSNFPHRGSSISADLRGASFHFSLFFSLLASSIGTGGGRCHARRPPG